MRKKSASPPLFARWLLNLLIHYEAEYSIVGDCNEEYSKIVLEERRRICLFSC